MSGIAGTESAAPEDPVDMRASTEVRTVRGWDVALAAAILAVVLFGWFTAAGSNYAGAPRSAPSVAHACPSAAAAPGRGRSATWGRCHRLDAASGLLPRGENARISAASISGSSRARKWPAPTDSVTAPASQHAVDITYRLPR